MIFAGIVAGGTGTRMGADIPKQFLTLCGKSIIIHTIEQFLTVSRIDKIYLGIHPEWTEYCDDLLIKYKLPKDRISIVGGGIDRNSTVFNIIKQIISDFEIGTNDIILTHDGVRPFVTKDIIIKNIKTASQYGACGTYIQAIDTIIQSSDGITVSNVPERSQMFQAQTPQSFNIAKLIKAYASLSESEKSMLTDTCSIFTAKGLPIRIVEGDSYNIKITTAKDLKLAEFIKSN